MCAVELKYIAVKDDFFSKPLYPLEKVNLMGTRCRDCGEVFMGKAIACQQCQSENLESIALSRTGKLYSYTINWNKPPGDYKVPEPFRPYAVGLVELPEGIRLVSVLTGVDFDKIKIGIPLELSVEELYKDKEDNTVVTFKFRPQSVQGRY
jgi:uncharacterized OB-fold protein